MGVKSPNEIHLVAPIRYAEMAQVSRKTALTWAKKGKITKYYFPGKARYFLNPAERPKKA